MKIFYEFDVEYTIEIATLFRCFSYDLLNMWAIEDSHPCSHEITVKCSLYLSNRWLNPPKVIQWTEEVQVIVCHVWEMAHYPHFLVSMASNKRVKEFATYYHSLKWNKTYKTLFVVCIYASFCFICAIYYCVHVCIRSNHKPIIRGFVDDANTPKMCTNPLLEWVFMYANRIQPTPRDGTIY